MNKYFSFEFTKTDSGWLDFEIHIQNATFHYFFSDDISTQPEELILWLEKIYNKDYCEFDCETEDFLFDFSNRLQLGKSQDEIKEIVKNAKNVPIQDSDLIFGELNLGDYSFRYNTDSSFNKVLDNEINVYHKVGDLFFWVDLNKKVLSINEILAPDDKLTVFGWNYLLYDLKERPDFIKSIINTMIKDIQKYIKPIFNSTQLLLYPDCSGLEDYLEEKSFDELLEMGLLKVLRNEEYYKKENHTKFENGIPYFLFDI